MTYYLLGIKGAGVSTLACILYDLGYKVIGYDDVRDYRFTEEELKKRNISIYYDDSFNEFDNVKVICSAAIKKDHKEIVRLQSKNVEFIDYQDMLGYLTKQFRTISVAGTHGKTTTTTILSNLFNKTANHKASYFIGDGHGHAQKSNQYFIIESCEFNKHFLKYFPAISIITNIEIEHMDVFKDEQDIIDTFNSFVSNTKDKVVACGDSLLVRKLDNKDNKIIYYGTTTDCDVYALNTEYSDKGISFDLYYNKEFYDHYEFALYGKHMLLNIIASITIAIIENISKEEIKKYLPTYKQATRRFNETFINDTIIIDDYAHHPSEIKATLSSAFQKYPNKKVIAVFRPNTYTRTKLLYKDFASELSKAYASYITDIYCDREKQSDYKEVSSKLILDLCSNSHKIDVDTVTDLLKYKGEVVCFMSCKDINDLKNKYIDLLTNNE